MKRIYKFYNLETSGKILNVSLRALFRAVGMEGDVTTGVVPADVLDCIRVLADRIGETGTQVIRKSDVGLTRYEVNEDQLTIYIGGLGTGISRVFVQVQYGTNQVSELCVDLYVPQEPKEGQYDDASDVDLAPVDTFGGAGGADYKTDMYMDGAGRVIVERLEDGSTMLLDEHENPIIKRNADGSTQYFDAYQSARLMISASGEVEVAYTEDETVKTLAVAEAILARTQKRLLYNTAGETTIKDAEGNILTHADIYAMLMTSSDFVVLVRSDHAFHPNLVTPTQIAFTCSHLGVDGQISAERVNISDTNEVTYTSGKGVTDINGLVTIEKLHNGDADCIASGVGSHAEGWGTTASGQWSHAEGIAWNPYNYPLATTRSRATGVGSHVEGCGNTASGISSHAEGRATKATGLGCHAEGEDTQANGEKSHAEGDGSITNGARSHAEGTSCTANGGTSHVEGNYCTTGTNGGSAHAEGSYTTANAAASHTEGYRTITTEGGSHAQGCWNKVEGGSYAFMHGCGTADADRKNAFLIAGDEVYMLGVGGYDGTNYGAEGVQSVQTVIRALQLKLVNL